MRFVESLICLTLFGSISLFSEAKEVEETPLSIRPFIENSTDEFGVLNKLMKANRLKSEGRCVEASQLYGFILQYDPNLEDAVLGLAQCQISLGQNGRALTILTRADIKSRDANILILMAKSRSLKSLERIAMLENKIAELDDSRLFNLLGNSYLEQSGFEQAKISYIQAHQSGQSKGLMENNLGILSLKKGDCQSAMSYFKKAKLLRPENTRFDNNYRLALLLNKQYVEALSDLDPERAIFFLYKAGLMAESQGEIRLAETLLQKAIDLSPTYFDAAEKTLQGLSH